MFWGRVDVEHIGISGHSQGGVAAFNAVNRQTHPLYSIFPWSIPLRWAHTFSPPMASNSTSIPSGVITSCSGVASTSMGMFVSAGWVKASKYKALFRHLASWGFIVLGNEDPSHDQDKRSQRDNRQQDNAHDLQNVPYDPHPRPSRQTLRQVYHLPAQNARAFAPIGQNATNRAVCSGKGRPANAGAEAEAPGEWEKFQADYPAELEQGGTYPVGSAGS